MNVRVRTREADVTKKESRELYGWNGKLMVQEDNIYDPSFLYAFDVFFPSVIMLYSADKIYSKDLWHLQLPCFSTTFLPNGRHTPLTPSPRSATKKLTSPFRCLSLKNMEEPEDETEHLQQPWNDPYQDLEIAYVAQVCLTWEALHCQYTQLIQKILCQLEGSMCYNHSAQQFQQFQVLLQRYMENEPFELGVRAEIYARARNLLPKLLQVPNGKGSNREEKGEMESDIRVLAPDLIKIMENSILTFHLFLKMDKRKANSVMNLFGSQNQIATPLQLIQSSLEKKRMRLKELCKKSKGWKEKSWPQMYENVELLFGLIDVKILSRVLRMAKISKEQLIWCEEKIKKLAVADGKLQRDPSPILFPC